MRIEIFVVKTEIDNNMPYLVKIGCLKGLEDLKAKICSEFGGLTEISNFKGYWLNEGKICVDIGDLWLIYTDSTDTVAIIDDFAKRIKKLTAQKSQLYTIDNKAYFV